MAQGKLVQFLWNDPGDLWARGDQADDLGPETPGIPELHLLRLHRTDEFITLTDPYNRNLIQSVGWHELAKCWHSGGSVVGALCTCGLEMTIQEFEQHKKGEEHEDQRDPVERNLREQ